MKQMGCLLCESDRSHPVWRQNGSLIERCGGCGVLFTVNPLSQAELVTLYDKGALTGTPTELIGKNHGPPPAWKQKEHFEILEQIKSLGICGGTLLDVGSFEGMFMRNAKQCGFGVMGVEPMREAFIHAHDTLGLPVVHGDLQSAAFPAASFTAVSLLDVIEHVSDPVAQLREVFRVLKRGGILVITTPNAAGLLQRIVATKRKICCQPWCPIDDVPWHLWGFTPSTIRLCMEKAGFYVKAVNPLEPSTLSTNENAGSTGWKRLILHEAARFSKVVRMSDRMVGFAQKRIATPA